MLDLYGPPIEAFVSTTLKRFALSYPSAQAAQRDLLERATREALESLLGCDCSYHDTHHTMLVTDAGQMILRGKVLSDGDLSSADWLQAVIAMLYHDVGYIRGVLQGDQDDCYIVDDLGQLAVPPTGATDAFLGPHHVSRSCLFVRERFAGESLIAIETLASHIEMTRFPVPPDAWYQPTDSISALVRSADLIGQMGDPQYPRKLARLYAEFCETGDADRLGYTSTGNMRDQFPAFFYEQVYPYIGSALRYLKKTPEGQQWIANLFHHVHGAANPAQWSASARPAVVEAVFTEPRQSSVTVLRGR